MRLCYRMEALDTLVVHCRACNLCTKRDQMKPDQIVVLKDNERCVSAGSQADRGRSNCGQGTVTVASVQMGEHSGLCASKLEADYNV